MCSAGVLAATIAVSEKQEEMIDDLLEGDVVGKIETLAVLLKVKSDLIVNNEKLASVLLGKNRFLIFFVFKTTED